MEAHASIFFAFVHQADCFVSAGRDVLSGWGGWIGLPEPGTKKGLSLFFPAHRAFKMFLKILAMPKKVATGVLPTFPRADLVFKAISTGPRAWSIDAGELPRHARITPTYATRGSLGVFAMGVWQQEAYQRKGPLSVRDRQATWSSPAVNRIDAGKGAENFVAPHPFPARRARDSVQPRRP